MSDLDPKVDYERHSVCVECREPVRAYETEIQPVDAGSLAIRWDWDHCERLWSWKGIYALPLGGIIVPMLFSGRARAEPELPKSALNYVPAPGPSPIEGMFWSAYRSLKPRELRGLVPQYKVGRYRIDYALPRQKIGIELDGQLSHSSVDAIAHDRFRQRALEKAGWRIIRFGGGEVYHDAEWCVREAASMVRTRRWHR